MKVALPTIALALTVSLLSFAPGALAQGADGEIRGVAVDLSGAALPDVIITIANTETGATRIVHSDTRGRFVAPGLRVGLYEVTAELSGFASRRQEDLRVAVGNTVTLRFELRPAIAPETITVAERPMTLDPARSHPAALIDEPAVTHLPVKSRNVLDLAPTVAGVTRDLNSGTIVIAGQPGNANTMSVDGGELLGFGSYQFSQEALEQVRVDLNGYRAEYGRASGGVIHAVTRSGTNAVHGSAMAFGGPSAWTPGDVGTSQAGGVLGGPIMRDRHFFLVNYDTLRRPVPFRNQTVFLIKTDHQLTGSDRLMFRYNDQDLRAGMSTRSSMAGVTAVFGSRILNDGRVHYAQSRDVLSVNRLQVADTLTWVGGGHEIKVGFDAVGDDASAAMAFRTLAGTTFSSPSVSEFVQDEWQAGQRVTLNVGARHDVGHDWDPRLGMTWLGGSRVVLRGSYGRFSSPLTDLSVRQGSGGVEWEWMPNTTLGVNYLDASAPESAYRAVTAEAARRFWQGTYYRFAYTFGRNLEHGGIPARYEPRHRLAMSVVYDTHAFAARFGGVLEKILTDWTASAIYGAQSSDQRVTARPLADSSFDPRIARNIALGTGRTLALILETYGRRNRPNLLTVTDAISPLQAGQPEGRLTQLGVRLLF